MFKKAAVLFIVAVLALTVIGCRGKKKADLTPEQREWCESLARGAVSYEIFTKYGLAAEITVENITDYDETQGSVYTRTTFTAIGSYSVTDDSGEKYSGTFTAECYSEGHGSGWDSCEISVPVSGSTELTELVS